MTVVAHPMDIAPGSRRPLRLPVQRTEPPPRRDPVPVQHQYANAGPDCYWEVSPADRDEPAGR